jgi:hypothetical protein
VLLAVKVRLCPGNVFVYFRGAIGIGTVAIERGAMLEAAHSESPARAAGGLCLSCVQLKIWSRDDL